SRGGVRPCQWASQATSSSNRPRLRGGLVSLASRRATAAAAAASPAGRSRQAARSSANEGNLPMVEFSIVRRVAPCCRLSSKLAELRPITNPSIGDWTMTTPGAWLPGLATDLKISVLFCTRLPLAHSAAIGGQDLARASWALPVAGALVGGIGAFTYWVAF